MRSTRVGACRRFPPSGDAAAVSFLRVDRRVGSSALRCRSHGSRSSYGATDPKEEEAMKYMLLIHQGDTPTPRSPEAWATLTEDEQRAVYADYQSINQTPGVTPGVGLDAPETATTVWVQDGKTLRTGGRLV